MLTPWQDNKGEGLPFAAHYTDPKQLIRVYFQTAEDIENLWSLSSQAG